MRLLLIWTVLLCTIYGCRIPDAHAQQGAYSLQTAEAVREINYGFESGGFPYRVLSMNVRVHLVGGRVTNAHGDIRLICKDNRQSKVNWVFSERPDVTGHVERTWPRPGMRPMTIDHSMVVLAHPVLYRQIGTSLVAHFLRACNSGMREPFVAIGLWSSGGDQHLTLAWDLVSPGRFQELVRY